MSVAVGLDELGDVLAQFGWCYVITVGESGRAHLVAVTPSFAGGVLTAQVGTSTAKNAAARSDVVLVFPPPDFAGMSLIVDASLVSSDPFTVRPTKATLHRAAPPAA